MSTLPVTVVVPHKTTRLSFFAQGCLPMVIRNAPAEIIVLPDDRLPAAKRAAGARTASSEFIFFCDDDVILRGGCLQLMVAALQADTTASFVYSDYDHVVHDGIHFPTKSGRWTAGPWDLARLRQGPYISAMSLFRKTAFPGMDETLTRFDTWDLWLTMAGKGARAAYIPEVLFESHHMDIGVTISVKPDEPLKKIAERHQIQL